MSRRTPMGIVSLVIGVVVALIAFDIVQRRTQSPSYGILAFVFGLAFWIGTLSVVVRPR